MKVVEQVTANDETHDGDLLEETKQSSSKGTEKKANDGEFRLTIRKLSLPVRPRGVLAE